MGCVLDPRLGTIAAMTGHCAHLADIGADHGLLGAFMLQEGLAGHVQLMDISAESLKRARTLIAELNLEDRAAFSVGDGLDALLHPADAIVIAGMGGQLIAQILNRGRARLNGARLILQPNVALTELRASLKDLGYCLSDERIARAHGRLYVVMRAEPGWASYTKEQLLVGPKLLNDPLLGVYAARMLGIAQRALAGARQGGAECAQELEWECAVWEGIKHGGQRLADL